MTLIYILVGVVVIHALFLLYPLYRDETLEVYTWTPWTEEKYALLKQVAGNNKMVRIRLLMNWILWPFLILFVVVMPVVFLFMLPGMLKEYDDEIIYSKDNKVLLKVAENSRRVKVKKGVEIIASGAFDGSMVVRVRLPNTVKILNTKAFLGAQYLKSLNLPNSIIKIGQSAFRFCGCFEKGLKKLVLPKHLHYLGENAFYGCKNLEKLIIRGDFKWTQSWLDNNPFYYTKSLSVIQSSNPNFKVEDGMLMSADDKILFRCVKNSKKIVVKDGIETIAQGAFCDRDRMEEVILPTSLRTICKDAFSGCSNIDNVELPEGTESIGVESFSFCRKLKKMTLPASLKEIAYGAFASSDHLQNFIYPKGKENEFKKMMSNGGYKFPS